MARIVELSYPDNVTLHPGATQHWVDLEPDRTASPLLLALVDLGLDRPVGRALVVGPHPLPLLQRLAAQVDELTVVVRSIPDAATIGRALPDASVRCGSVEPACMGEEYDLVVALSDLALTLSLEDDQSRSWRTLADEVLRRVADGGRLLLGVENELGLHRVAEPLDPRMRDDDANWSPLATWDESRPRSRDALHRVCVEWGRQGVVHELLPTWSAPTVAAVALDAAPRTLRDLGGALAGRSGVGDPPVPALLHRRALALADSLLEACAGWVLDLGADPADPALVHVAEGVADRTVWRAAGGDTVHGRSLDGTERELAVARAGGTLLVDLVEAAVASDLPRLRSILGTWRRALVDVAEDGLLPATHADARFANLLVADADDPETRTRGAVPLVTAPEPAPLDEVTWTAIADLYSTWRLLGLRHPWPSSMHPQTVFESLVVMCGAPVPPEPGRWVSLTAVPGPAGQTRQELLAVIERQREELRGAWSRFHWDEKDYLVYKASRLSKRTVRFVGREGLRGTARRARRFLGGG